MLFLAVSAIAIGCLPAKHLSLGINQQFGGGIVLQPMANGETCLKIGFISEFLFDSTKGTKITDLKLRSQLPSVISVGVSAIRNFS